MAQIGVAGTCFQGLTGTGAMARQLHDIRAYRERSSELEGGYNDEATDDETDDRGGRPDDNGRGRFGTSNEG
jgi:hypothetical protein